nr:disks large-associated protein 5 isoform X1 [Monopterus albus]XP_020471521.1 disks large-associated protein 5 isoform X1 [Monopterus albus]
MESRFAHLRQRDTSVSMLRVKMSRRRSQSQKENRERAMNARRQLDKLPELEMSSLDVSIAATHMSTIQERTQSNAKSAESRAEDRLKQLERWKERKAFEREKRERELKGVFKTGLYHPKDTLTLIPLPVVPAAPNAPKRAKEIKVNLAPSQSTRVTRSMKQQQQLKPMKAQDPHALAKKAQPAVERSKRSQVAPVKPAPTKTKVCAVEPIVGALTSRSTNRPPVTAVPLVKHKPKDKTADVRITRSRAVVNTVAPPLGREGKCKAPVINNNIQPPVNMEPKLKEPEEEPHSPSLTQCSDEEHTAVDQAPADSVPASNPVVALPSLSSFAPDSFVFQVPAGLSPFKFEPLTPRSADAFLTPSCSFSLPPAPMFSAEPSEPSPSRSPHCSPPRTSPTVAPLTPGSPLESKHDVLYFRSEIANETDRLTALCVHWESKVEDESIPEEMRDYMRTVVGQAKLLIKERFNQFSGLVDDCELGCGEKIITCTDLQGFWDMVYYQVEDVNKKFNALKEAEGRGWVEEHQPPPRQRKVVKKPSAASFKPTGTKAAAKSRLAAVKAAMKARQQKAEAEKAAKDAGNTEDNQCLNSQEPHPQAEAQVPDTVVFDGGFFQVESPAKALGSVRRSSRLSAAVLPRVSPFSNSFTPRRSTQRSVALSQTPVQMNAQPVYTPAHLHLILNQTPAKALKSQQGTPELTQKRKDVVNVSLCFSPVKEVCTSPVEQSGTVSPQDDTAAVPELVTPIPVHSLLPIVVEEQDKPAEAVNIDLPLSSSLSLSPCKMPTFSKDPEPSSSLSFTLSPCGTPSQPAMASPPPVQGLLEAQESLCPVPDTSVAEESLGLDDCYLQPSQRCSLPSSEAVAIEMQSPAAVDVEMRSPRDQSEDLLTQREPAQIAVPSVFTLQSPQSQTAESALLLFIPDVKDRIRESVCPSDLMVFTPPSNK